MEEQKNLNSLECFYRLAGIFTICYILFFAILKVIFTFVVQIDSNNTPLQIFTNSSILIFSTIVTKLNF